MGIQIGKRHNLSIGGSAGRYWNKYFTGIPVKYVSNPLKEIGTGNDIYEYFRACVLVDGIYHTFYENYENFSGTYKWTIRKRVSTDGILHTIASAVLLAAGGAGTYDELGSADPTVIYDGPGDWKMWFDAKNGIGIWDQLGYATSVDGTTWANQGGVIARGSAGSWDDGFIHHPTVIKYNGVYYMYYTGGKNDTSGYCIGLATSTDGVNWTKNLTNPVLSPGASGQWDDYNVRPSCPILIGNIWYMWYWGFGNADPSDHAMGLASSRDLINWTKKGRVMYRDSATDGVAASNGMLIQGSNSMDKLVKMWFTTSAEHKTKYSNITLPSLLTKVSQFVPLPIFGTVFGDPTPTGSFDLHAGNYIYFTMKQLTSEITPDVINVFFSKYLKPTTGNVKCALYYNNSGTPTTLLATSEEKNWADIIGGEWTNFIITSPTVLPAAWYYIAVWSSVNYYKPKISGGSSNWGNKSLAYGNFPAPVTATCTQSFSGVGVACGLSTNLLRKNIWQATLNTSPNIINFNGVRGINKESIDTINAEYNWFWDSNLLYIYSNENPDLRYQITYE